MYLRHRSFSSIALTLVSSAAPWPSTPADGCARTQPAGALTLPECRPGLSIWRRARAGPGWRADRHRPPEDGSRTSAAARAGGPRPASRRGAPRSAGGAARRTSRGAGRSSRGTAPAPRCRRRASRGRAPGSAPARQGVLADGHEARLAALALDAHLLGVEVDRADVEVDELLRAQAARVGELEQRAVALLERRRGRDPVEQRGDVGGLERARQALGQLRRGEQLGGVGLHQAVLDEHAEARAQRRRACATTVRGASPRSAICGGVAAQPRVVDVGGRERRSGPPSGRAPRRRCGRRARVPLGRAAAAQVLVEQRERVAPGARAASPLPFGAMASFFIDTDTGQVATLRQLVEAGVADADRAAAAAVAPDPGHARRHDHVVRGACASGSAASSSARSSFATPTTMPPCCNRVGRRSPVERDPALGS